MLLEVFISFDQEEKTILREAVSPIRQLDEALESNKRTINKIIDNKFVDIQSAISFSDVLDRLLVKIKEGTTCVAAPEWIENVRQQKESGQVPVVAYPEQAVKMLNDVRRGQAKTIEAAIRIVQQAILSQKESQSTIESLNPCKYNKP